MIPWIHPIIFVDGLRVAVRTEKGVLKKCVYAVLGVSLSGRQDVLGLWIEETEGARFWLKVFNDLKVRGVADALIVCGDGLNGLRHAVEAVFPQADVQLCVVHHIRSVTKFVSWKDRKPLVPTRVRFTLHGRWKPPNSLSTASRKTGRVAIRCRLLPGVITGRS